MILLFIKRNIDSVDTNKENKRVWNVVFVKFPVVLFFKIHLYVSCDLSNAFWILNIFSIKWSGDNEGWLEYCLFNFSTCRFFNLSSFKVKFQPHFCQESLLTIVAMSGSPPVNYVFHMVLTMTCCVVFFVCGLYPQSVHIFLIFLLYPQWSINKYLLVDLFRNTTIVVVS